MALKKQDAHMRTTLPKLTIVTLLAGCVAASLASPAHANQCFLVPYGTGYRLQCNSGLDNTDASIPLQAGKPAGPFGPDTNSIQQQRQMQLQNQILQQQLRLMRQQ